MIEINYYENNGKYGIKATGHAYYDEPGRDIVCAGVCVLLQSLGMYLDANPYCFKILENKHKAGDINIEVELYDLENQVVPNLFYMTISGLEAISNTYPNNVKVTENIN